MKLAKAIFAAVKREEKILSEGLRKGIKPLIYMQ